MSGMVLGLRCWQRVWMAMSLSLQFSSMSPMSRVLVESAEERCSTSTWRNGTLERSRMKMLLWTLSACVVVAMTGRGTVPSTEAWLPDCFNANGGKVVALGRLLLLPLPLLMADVEADVATVPLTEAVAAAAAALIPFGAEAAAALRFDVRRMPLILGLPVVDTENVLESSLSRRRCRKAWLVFPAGVLLSAVPDTSARPSPTRRLA
mmetsp:Transcript_5074/g.14827  ORF Transcript_5074/g.14827 Transcript_5074/m.14827 type:complete len:207 (+) Transcript_5074:3215-3835(+)